MVRVRRAPHGKSQLGPILVGQWQHPVTCATAKMAHSCIQSPYKRYCACKSQDK